MRIWSPFKNTDAFEAELEIKTGHYTIIYASLQPIKSHLKMKHTDGQMNPNCQVDKPRFAASTMAHCKY